MLGIEKLASSSGGESWGEGVAYVIRPQYFEFDTNVLKRSALVV